MQKFQKKWKTLQKFQKTVQKIEKTVQKLQKNYSFFVVFSLFQASKKVEYPKSGMIYKREKYPLERTKYAFLHFIHACDRKISPTRNAQ